jgi:hypothetical protein
VGAGAGAGAGGDGNTAGKGGDGNTAGKGGDGNSAGKGGDGNTAGKGGDGGAAGQGGELGGGGQGGNDATETEPNDGTTLTEVNPIAPGIAIAGSIGTPGDADIFSLPATPGQIYVATLTPTAGSQLHAHLTVFDAGRGKKAAGEDYVKIAVGQAGEGAVVELLAMGQGGYLVAVRDERNVAGSSAGIGGANFGYRLTVTELPASDRIVGPLVLPGKTTGAFASPGALALYSFDAADGMQLSADFAPGGADLDGRFFVFSTVTSDWAARNDNRSATNDAPLFDQVPVQPAGPCYLVVENIVPEAVSLGFTITSTTP